MADLKLSLALMANSRTRAIIEGSVRPAGIELITTVCKAGGEVFWRQLHFQDFDVAEMSLSDVLMMISRGDRTWVMLPTFFTRRFFHTNVIVRAAAGIEKPADLKGKRMGVMEYVQTANVWARGILKDEFGVAPEDMHWYQERPEHLSHSHFFGMQKPVEHFEYVPAEKSIGAMLVAGELDAVVTYAWQPNLVNRSSVNLKNHPAARPLFKDSRGESLRYYEKTGIFPINHGLVIRRSIVERHPWVAMNLYNAMVAAKKQALEDMRETADLYSTLGWLNPEGRKALDRDALPCGVKSNRQTLEACARYSYEQGLSPRLVQLEEVFAPSTLDF